jgi:hypothetical protein
VKIQWRIHRHQDVTAYLVSLREAGQEIRAHIESLKATGIPADAMEVEPHNYFWLAAGHWIGCVVDEQDKALYIANIDPVDDV